jgi:glycosyltransferase involved in cell wall biosynthesis
MSTLGVVVPAFRAASTIARTVASARACGADRVLVVDDGSDDDTAHLAQAAGAEVVAQQNAGAARAREHGAELIGTDYVVFLDSDDELLPEGVRRSVELLDSDDRVGVAAGTVIGVGTDGAERPFPVRFTPVDAHSLLVKGHGPWPPCAAVVRRTAYEKALALELPPLKPPYAEDYELLIRLSMVSVVEVRPDPTCRYSLSGGKSVRSAQSAIDAKEDIRRYYADHLGIEIEPMSAKHRDMAAQVRQARALWSSGDRVAAAGRIAAWAARDPAYAIRKLATKPWQRN